MTDAPPPPESRVVNHPRDEACQSAGAELVAFVNEWRVRHGLTVNEALFLFTTMVGRTLQQMAIDERPKEGGT